MPFLIHQIVERADDPGRIGSDGRGKCILQLRGVRPFLSDKYDMTKHPNYKYTFRLRQKNAFDVERYMSTRPAIVKPDEPLTYTN